tara:strand:- start:317 stop:586 length:270 start_codon:yes stop_codon:yes gene_type:complete
MVVLKFCEEAFNALPFDNCFPRPVAAFYSSYNLQHLRSITEPIPKHHGRANARNNHRKKLSQTHKITISPIMLAVGSLHSLMGNPIASD